MTNDGVAWRVLSGIEAAVTDRVPGWAKPLVSTDRVGRFICTGAVGVAVELAVLAALVEFAITGEIVGDVVGKEAAVVVMFALNERWTFSDRGRPGLRALARRLLRSNVVRALGNGIALAVYAALVLWTGIFYLAAALAGIVVGFAFNYTFEGLWTWRSRRVHEG